MGHVIKRHLLAGAALALAVTAGACVKDSTGPGGTGVVRDAAFVGYSTPETKQTTCGNCHLSKQRTWIETRHASAWADLQASGHASASCNPCHTTNGTSNAASDSAGFLSVSADARKFYQDVQCEACHGPGQTHITAPDETQPIAFFTVYDSAQGVGCGTCHSGTHNPFREEWTEGAHGGLESHAVAAGGSCLQCHEGKTVLSRFGGSDAYVEKTSATPQPITCVVCHDPHADTNMPQLRYSITVRDTTNLCIQCHKRRSVPDVTSTRGPHSPQGPTLLGISGWRPVGFTWDTVANRPAHADAGNPDLCAGCHVFRFAVNNAQGQFAYQSTGHTFFGLPCLKTDGTPDTTNTCATASRSFKACANGGCHGSETSARNTFLANDSTLSALANALWTDSNGNAAVDTLPIDQGMLANTKVPRTEFLKRNSTTTTPYTVAEGALFNVRLFRDSDLSHGVHNPRYIKALLWASIRAVNTTYGVPIPAGLAPRFRQIGEELGLLR